jgi:putative drug exporter of the RND superfamily
VLERLADVVYRRRRLVLAGSLVFVVLAFAIGGRVLSLLTSSARDFEDPGSQSVDARRQLERTTGANPEISVIALIRPGTEIAAPAGTAEVRRVAKVMAADKAVARVFTAFNTGNRAFLSRDGRSSYVVASFAPLSGKQEADAAKRIERALKHDPAVTLGGPAIATSEADDQIGRDLARAEQFGIPILILLSLLFFRGLVAALLPIATGIFAVAGTFLVLRLVDAFAPLSVFAINMVTGLGIGLGIDYSLFILSRYREEMVQSGPGREALVRTLGTAGRTVVFSSLTVAAAVAALFAFPQRFLYSMGLGGAFVALFSAVSALVFLSAIVAVLGRRVDSISPRWLRKSAEREASAERSGFWYRLSRTVMRYPLPIATVTVAVLILLGIPFLNVRFTGSDASILPTTASARQVQDAIAADFRENETSPIYIAAVAPAASAISRYAERLRSLPNVLRVNPPIPPPPGRGGSTWRVDVFSEQSPLTDATKRLVKTIRARGAPFPISVGGESAAFVDQESSIRGHLPLGLGIAATTTIILLFLMTGSLVLPLKTIILNILSLSATLGFLVLIFQYGHLEGLLDFTSQGALNMTQPILIGAIAFALSTDYAVFLLTRIKEARDAGYGETESVAVGIERTGRIVTAAALLLAVAIGAFATSKIILIKELGLGVAFAVLLDATIVRALLVPALMKMLGRWNWWAPAPLRRVHERFGFAEAPVSRQPAAP